MSHNGLTGLTGSEVNGPRTGAKPGTPVRPVSGAELTGPDGTAGYIGTPRAGAGRKPSNPSDPSGPVRSIATVAAEKGRRTRGQRQPDVIHAVASVPVVLGSVTCRPGEPLCGTRALLQPCLDGTPSAVTCHLCAALADRERITLAGSDAA